MDALYYLEDADEKGFKSLSTSYPDHNTSLEAHG